MFTAGNVVAYEPYSPKLVEGEFSELQRLAAARCDGCELKEIHATGEGTDDFRTTRALIS